MPDKKRKMMTKSGPRLYAVSTSIQRRIAVYPHPKYYALTLGYAGMGNLSKAEVLEEAIKEKFDRMTPEEQARILKFYSQMTEGEKKNPRKMRNEWQK